MTEPTADQDRRDSAAAVGAVAVWAAAHDPKTVVAVSAADHVLEDGKQFARLCAQAYAAANSGEIVTARRVASGKLTQET